MCILYCLLFSGWKYILWVVSAFHMKIRTDWCNPELWDTMLFAFTPIWPSSICDWDIYLPHGSESSQPSMAVSLRMSKSFYRNNPWFPNKQILDCKAYKSKPDTVVWSMIPASSWEAGADGQRVWVSLGNTVSASQSGLLGETSFKAQNNKNLKNHLMITNLN